jgi:hypothetical protein
MREYVYLLVVAISVALGVCWLTNGAPLANAVDRAPVPAASDNEQTVTGTIIAIEKGMPRFVIGCPDGSVVQLQVEMKAVIQRDRSRIDVGDFRPGDRVVVNYRVRDGANVAYSILVTRDS